MSEISGDLVDLASWHGVVDGLVFSPHLPFLGEGVDVGLAASDAQMKENLLGLFVLFQAVSEVWARDGDGIEQAGRAVRGSGNRLGLADGCALHGG